MQLVVEQQGLLGTGAFGEVFLVVDATGKKCALKKTKVDPFLVDQGLRQIQLMQKVVHPNLVEVFAYFYDDAASELNILMQYCDQGDLLRFYKARGGLTHDEALHIFRQIVQGCLALNANQMIHRDLKPENVLMSKGMTVKIADFGCAREIKRQEMSKIENFSLDKGTVDYASPEQLLGKPYSAKCDIWAAGCILYFMAFKSHPFPMLPHHTDKHDAIIEKLRMGDFLPAKTHPLIEQALHLTLQHSELQRATWRELWLARALKPQMAAVQPFLQYLSHVATIAVWLIKAFWKQRKEISLTKHYAELFIFFISKFQFTAMELALRITRKDPQWAYLFTAQAFQSFMVAPQFMAKLNRLHTENQKYFTNIKRYMEEKSLYSSLMIRQPYRFSCFADLDGSIRAAYKIASEAKGQLKQEMDCRVWICLGRWVNFDRFFAFEAHPRIEKLLGEALPNPNKELAEQIGRYERGEVD